MESGEVLMEEVAGGMLEVEMGRLAARFASVEIELAYRDALRNSHHKLQAQRKQQKQQKGRREREGRSRVRRAEAQV